MANTPIIISYIYYLLYKSVAHDSQLGCTFKIGLEWKIACQAALLAAAKTDIIYFIFIIFCYAVDRSVQVFN